MRRTVVRSAGWWATLRDLIRYNRANAVYLRSATSQASTSTNTTTSSATSTPKKLSTLLTSTTSESSANKTTCFPFDPPQSGALDIVEDVVRRRWGCRSFDPERSIDKTTLARILDATTRAPTGYNLQGWHAIVVDDAAQRAALSAAALQQRHIRDAAAVVVFAGDTNITRNATQALESGLSCGYYPPRYGPYYLRSLFYHLHGGPCNSLALAKRILSRCYSAQTSTPLLTVPLSGTSYSAKQTMIPATMFTLLCTAAGWQTLMVEGFDESAVRDVVKLPADFTVPVMICVGYGAQCDAQTGRSPHPPAASPRFATSHLIRWGTF